MNRFNIFPKRFFHMTQGRSGIFTFHDQAPIPRKPVKYDDKTVTVTGYSAPLVEEKPGVVLYPIKKSPNDAQHCEEIFSENPKETPPLFYQYDALQEPTMNLMYSDYNNSLNEKKLPCREGDDYSYHPFYMDRPFEKLTPDVIDKLSELDAVQEASPPPPKCSNNLNDICGPIVVQDEKTSKED